MKKLFSKDIYSGFGIERRLINHLHALKIVVQKQTIR